MKRNASIELWRCFCMLAVVCSHIVVNNGVGSFAVWMWHVPGFLLITAFFGIRFRWIKVLKLLGICYGCYWLTIPLRGGAIDFVDLVLPHGGWFVPFYIVLMMLSPILNAAIMAGNHRQMALIVGALLMLAWCPCFCPRLGMMRIAGMQGSGMLLMISIYLLARLAAEHSLLHKVNRFVGGGGFSCYLMWFLSWFILDIQRRGAMFRLCQSQQRFAVFPLLPISSFRNGSNVLFALSRHQCLAFTCCMSVASRVGNIPILPRGRMGMLLFGLVAYFPFV